ncbi:fatty acid metabolism transcriptional regulator FadR [Herpetosiphon sp. NSE202]|uniref:fatty acid metabolism transcriptional regulator FadR n=1 Tax=Herpetosiphon sp. NSE202 TaxID=3351349 RepID=UPI003633DD48
MSELQRPASYCEAQLIKRIIGGSYAAGTSLPSERELAGQLGVTRPTLREAIQRLARDGWLVVQQGKPTMVCNIWQDGGLGVLRSLVQHSAELPAQIVPQLLAVRLDLAPSYTALAIQHHAEQIVGLLQTALPLADTAMAYAAFDWQLQHQLTIASTNPIYTLILNGFRGFYTMMALNYFELAQARQQSADFYQTLLQAAKTHDVALARQASQAAMHQSIELWQQLSTNTNQ